MILTQLHSYGDIALLALRFSLGAVFWVHGRSKRGTWRKQPGPGQSAAMLNLLRTLSICEPLCALSFFTGLLVQVAAVGAIVLMGGVIWMKSQVWKTPFSAHDKTGWELDLVMLAGSLILFIMGSGGYSLDRLLLHI